MGRERARINYFGEKCIFIHPKIATRRMQKQLATSNLNTEIYKIK